MKLQARRRGARRCLGPRGAVRDQAASQKVASLQSSPCSLLPPGVAMLIGKLGCARCSGLDGQGGCLSVDASDPRCT